MKSEASKGSSREKSRTKSTSKKAPLPARKRKTATSKESPKKASPKVKTMRKSTEKSDPIRKATEKRKRSLAPITEEMISQRAHQIWIDEGYPEGRADEHWLRAERELREARPS